MHKITAFKGTITATSKWTIEVRSKEATFVKRIWPVDTAITKETGGDPEDNVLLTGHSAYFAGMPTLSILHEHRCIFNITSSPQMAP
jgi:hypothetical protein